MSKRHRLLIGVGVSVVLFGCASAYAAIDGERRWLASNLRPDVFDRAIWCWGNGRAKAEVAASESRRDRFVVHTTLLGAAGADRDPRTKRDIIGWVSKLDRDTDLLGYVYSFYWSPADRKQLFARVAASRPVCSSTFGPDAGRAVTRSAS